MPILVEAYKIACRHDNNLEKIRPPHLSALSETLTDIIAETNHSLTIIDILLMNIKGVELGPEAYSLLSMRDCINESLERYPFRDNQKELVEVTGREDFQFKGVRQLIVHVFYNLIKNSLYAIAANNKTGSITISIHAGEDQNRVYFKDTGSGIDAEVLPHIFDNFYSTRAAGPEGSIGIGLSFCKNALAHFNAGIECVSEEGIYTEFILSFPILDTN